MIRTRNYSHALNQLRHNHCVGELSVQLSFIPHIFKPVCLGFITQELGEFQIKSRTTFPADQNLIKYLIFFTCF